MVITMVGNFLEVRESIKLHLFWNEDHWHTARNELTALDA